MHKSYRLGKNLSHQTQIFCWITETHSQPIQGYLLSPWVFLRLDIISQCRGGRREGHDPQCHESTHASPGIGSPCPQPLSQASHWWAVPCSWWHGPFMSTYFLCSFHAMLESLRIILLPPCWAGALELWQSYLWASMQHTAFLLWDPAAFMPWGRLPHWDYNLGNTGPGLQLGPTNAFAVLTFPPSSFPLHHARETFSNLKQKFCGLLWCVSHTFCLCQFSSFP